MNHLHVFMQKLGFYAHKQSYKGKDAYFEIGAGGLTKDQAKRIKKAFDIMLEEAKEEVKRELLFDLDEIENKPWRVFRQLAKIMPEYAENYISYEAYYAYGGSRKVEELIEDFKKTVDYNTSGFPEKIERANNGYTASK